MPEFVVMEELKKVPEGTRNATLYSWRNSTVVKTTIFNGKTRPRRGPGKSLCRPVLVSDVLMSRGSRLRETDASRLIRRPVTLWGWSWTLWRWCVSDNVGRVRPVHRVLVPYRGTFSSRTGFNENRRTSQEVIPACGHQIFSSCFRVSKSLGQQTGLGLILPCQKLLHAKII